MARRLSLLAFLPVCLLSLGAGESRAQPRRLTDEDIDRKITGGYVTGLPLLAYNTDMGFGGGARAYYFWNGPRDDPLFEFTPYLHRIFVQAFASTRGLQFHWIDYDAPNFLHSSYRLRSQLILERNINRNYFGLGEAALAPLRFPGSGDSFSSYRDYWAAQHEISDGLTWSKYDQLDIIRPLWVASVERNYLQNRLRILGGVGLSYAQINDYTGRLVNAVDASGASTQAVMAETRLRQDCDAGLVVGCDGGWDNVLRFGISYDSRDFEPDPKSGIFYDVALDVGTAALGSQYHYARMLFAARHYVSPISGYHDLVVAGRAVFVAQTSGAPFFSMNVLPFTEDTRAGLGGHRTMRGFRQDRFVGGAMAVTNAEVRWTFARTELWRQQLGFMLAPFLDVGRPFDSVRDFRFRDWRPSYGGAFRVSWNLATIITVDYGVSAEDTGLYINFNHIF